MSGTIAMFPLGMVVYPHQTVGLCVFEPRYHRLLEDVEHERRFGTCLIERGSDVGGDDQRTFVGSMLEILGTHRLSNGQTLVVAEGVECFEVVKWLSDDPYPRAIVGERCCDNVPIEPAWLKSTESAVRALLSNPNDRLRLVSEICAERYGDYQRMLAVDELRAPTAY
ncbi:MAG: LON peptidase substrate-binding domain-containing protein [Acidimicrobiales bacterium]